MEDLICLMEEFDSEKANPQGLNMEEFVSAMARQLGQLAGCSSGSRALSCLRERPLQCECAHPALLVAPAARLPASNNAAPAKPLSPEQYCNQLHPPMRCRHGLRDHRRATGPPVHEN